MGKTVKFVLVVCALLCLMTVSVWAQAPAASPAATKAAATAAPATAPAAPAAPAGGAGAGRGAGADRPAPIMGTVTSVDAATKTVKFKDAAGKEQSVKLAADTRIGTFKDGARAEAKFEDIKADMGIRIMGALDNVRGVTIAPKLADLQNMPARGGRGGGAGAGAAPAAGGAAPAAPAASPKPAAPAAPANAPAK